MSKEPINYLKHIADECSSGQEVVHYYKRKYLTDHWSQLQDFF